MTMERTSQDHKTGLIRRNASGRLVAVCLATLAALNGCGGGDAPEPELWSKTIERAAAQATGRPDVSSVVSNTKDIKPAISPPGQTASAHVTERTAAALSSSTCYPPHQFETVYFYWVVVVNGSIPTNGISTIGSYNKPIFPTIYAPVRGASSYCPSDASYEDAMAEYMIEMQIRSIALKQSAELRQMLQDALSRLHAGLSDRLMYCTQVAGSALQCPEYPFGTSVQAFFGEGASLQEMVSSGRYSMVLNYTISRTGKVPEPA